jgi:hypothetical protein
MHDITAFGVGVALFRVRLSQFTQARPQDPTEPNLSRWIVFSFGAEDQWNEFAIFNCWDNLAPRGSGAARMASQSHAYEAGFWIAFQGAAA